MKQWNEIKYDMELRLHQSKMGLATKNGNNLPLNITKGIDLTRTKGFKIIPTGKIRPERKNIRLEILG